MRENLGLKLLAIVIAVTLWAVVFGTKTIEITKDVPFEMSFTAVNEGRQPTH